MLRALLRFPLMLLRLLARTLDLFARSVFYLLVLAALGVVLSMWFHPAPSVPQGAALVLQPVGEIVEQTTLEPPLALLRPGGTGGTLAGQVALADLVEAVRAARDDKRIAALVLETDALVGAGFSKLAELRAAIADFKAAGKPVLARGERFTQHQYYLASAADEVHLSRDGFVLLRGLARYGLYFRQALDTLGIKVHVFRAGEYKSFAEPFTRNDMSAADRRASQALLDDLWAQLRDDIAASRKLAPAQLDAHVKGLRDALAAAGGDAAEAARVAGLIDRFSTPDEWRARLVELVGTLPGSDAPRRIDSADYLAVLAAEDSAAAAQVAVIVAQGAIVDGNESGGVVAGETFAALVRAAREDDDIKAVVIRIDSPGGSAWASEQIRRELELTRQAGKPVIASMSSVAASGGYWIAAGADEIWAAPATLTGSIGVFGLLPDFSAALQRLGVGVDGVATAPLAGALDPRRPLDRDAGEALQLTIDHGYRRFLDTVAQARKMSPAQVDVVARGRVWSGAAAQAQGLVDRLGGLHDAIEAAARRAGLSDYDVVWPAVEESMQHRLLRRLLGGEAGLAAALPGAGPATTLVGALHAVARDLARWNDPQHLYLHCLCAAP